MPRKGHKAASRQAKLRQRRRRGRSAAETFDAGPRESASPAPTATVEPPAPEESTTPESAARQQVAPRPARRPRRVTSAEAVPMYSYLGSELRSVGLITTLIAAILIALTFVLGG